MKLNSITILILFFCFSIGFSQELKPFKEGDRVAFLGNSITEAGYYENYIWLYYMTHFPEERLKIMNAGIGGDTAEMMNARFNDDVLALDPNYIVLTFGMNDSGYFEFWEENADEIAQKKVENSLKYFKEIQQKFQNNPEITPVIMSGSPFDETAKIDANNFDGKKETIEKIVAFQEAAAKKNNWSYVDLYHSMLSITEREQLKDSSYTITGPDRIHPGKPGHLVMAALFLKNQGLAGQVISDIQINAKKAKLDKTLNAEIQNLKANKTQVSYNYKARSLPFPIDSVSGTWGNPHKQHEALAVYPFIKEFNQELLKIDNLKNGNYQLSIDGENIAQFTSDSLAKGINLALLSNTPQYKQAKNIMFLNDVRAEIENKMRQYAWVQFNFMKERDLLFADSQEAFDTVNAIKEGFLPSKVGYYQTLRFKKIREMWQEDMEEITNMIYEMNQPKEHSIRLALIE
ncbi:SGNH/GDSL hydrolase family protein [Mesonia sp.]|uniref:SGNH/GDSL hydrolase family protein n=1 Tax=Mesonia sp. TaxID=1960830 RepID=UPI001753E723|nr:SGNH/GDSL hydrolase family protein [Mesonia sp.]HIB38542.1 GDSL family lipase [Mesonia sp.]HIO26405.1 GDSL family lipase [Flavobacteriaceae bacterium]